MAELRASALHCPYTCREFASLGFPPQMCETQQGLQHKDVAKQAPKVFWTFWVPVGATCTHTDNRLSMLELSL